MKNVKQQQQQNKNKNQKLKQKQIKYFFMIFYPTHRSVVISVVIMQRGCEKMQRLTARLKVSMGFIPLELQEP